MSELRDKIDLNAPAFGQGAQKLTDIKDSPGGEPQVPVTPPADSQDDGDSSVEETKVPYSRFKNVNEARREAEAEAERWRLRASELESSHTPRYEAEDSNEMPSYWKELYGDSDASQKAWNIQQRREEEIEQRAYEAGQRGAAELETIQRERINSNVATIDDNFEDLEAYVGRDLTAKEQSAILDIVDDYTAKDSEGNYEGAIMPFDKAWEIYELKQNSGRSATRKDRDNVASLSGTSTQGDTSADTEQNKNWNPFEKGSWKRRLGN